MEKQQLILAIAIACHEANKVWCEANNDLTQLHWANAEQWQRDSAIKGVEFRLDNPKAGKDTQHNAWMKDKVDAGWIYGEVKDALAKIHPCIVSFEQLPEFQQKKDALFCAIVDALKPQVIAPLTFGQKAVGLTFNHGTGEVFTRVDVAKKTCADAIDQMKEIIDIEGRSERAALATIAYRKIQSAQMDMVKAITWKD